MPSFANAYSVRAITKFEYVISRIFRLGGGPSSCVICILSKEPACHACPTTVCANLDNTPGFDRNCVASAAGAHTLRNQPDGNSSPPRRGAYRSKKTRATSCRRLVTPVLLKTDLR